MLRLLDFYYNGGNNVSNEEFDINCVDPLGRSALIIAIENENLALIELLLKYDVKPNEALLHAINEEFVEGIQKMRTQSIID